MQRSTLTAIAAAAFVVGAAGVQSAQASSTTIRSTPVLLANEHGIPGATAIPNDPQLANRVINVVSVNIPTGHDWLISEVRIQLTTGSAYNAAPPGGTEGSPSGPALWSVPAFSPGAYDTFVTSKNLAAAFIAGKLNPDLTSGEPPAEGLTTNNSPLVSVSWGNTIAGEEGTFEVGQFTLSADATGTFFGRTYSTDQTGSPFHVWQGQVVAGVMVPEPTSLAGLVAVGGGLLLRRRRKA